MTARLMLGTPEVHWLWDPDPRLDPVTLFVAYNRFTRRSPNRVLPKALHHYCYDSSGFTMVKKTGGWPMSAQAYANEVRRHCTQLGLDKCRWIAPQDWMCEPWVIFGKNQHLSPGSEHYFHGTREARGLAPGDPEQSLEDAVLIHQRYTVENLVELRRIAPDLPFIPVLQGWGISDYLRCVEMYAAAGVDLTQESTVGLGSVCRRQSTAEIASIVSALQGLGLRLHGFGVKMRGLADYGDLLVSADSQAWSFGYRKKKKRLPQCTHATCGNCKEGALDWWNRASLPTAVT